MTDDLIDRLPGTITRNGVKYRLIILKSSKGSYTLLYKPLHGKLPPFMSIIGNTLSAVAEMATQRLGE